MKNSVILFVAIIILLVMVVIIRSARPGSLRYRNELSQKEIQKFENLITTSTKSGVDDLTASPLYLTGETREKKSDRISKSLNIPIVFYGSVTDQDSKPLRGASVSARGVRALGLGAQLAGAGEFIECTPVMTDDNGRFTVQGVNGYGLLIVSIVKEGYRMSRESRSFSYQRNFPDVHQPDSKNPVKFHMVRDDIPRATKQLAKRQRFAWNAGIVTVELAPEIGHLNLEPIRHWENRGVSYGFDWSVNVRTDGFVMLPINRENPTPIAPEGEYVDQFIFGSKSDESPWLGGINEVFAIRTKTRLFGTIALNISSRGDENASRCHVTVYLNNSGARIIDHE